MMKKINFYFVISLAAAVISLTSCSKDSEKESAATVITTPLQVEAEISRSVLFDGNTSIEYYFSIMDNNVPVNNATITVNGTVVPRVVGFIDGYYDLRESSSPKASYVPGTTYNVSVTYGENLH